MPMPRARTRTEAHLYMSLTGCPCGEVDFDRDVDLVQPRGPRILHFHGACTRCGRLREFWFELPDDAADEPPAPRLGPDAPEAPDPGFGSGRSTLIDAGEWLLVSDLYDEALAELVEREDLADDQIPDIYELLLACAGAVDQALAFLPPDADRVPDDGFWTERGLAVRHALPDRFRRDELAAARSRRWQAVSDFEDVHEAPLAEENQP
jgi:hypothetical protein